MRMRSAILTIAYYIFVIPTLSVHPAELGSSMDYSD